MKRIHSELFAPYRFIGVVTGDVAPSVRTTFVGKKSMLSVLCPVDNVILHYNGNKLRPIGMSNPFLDKVTAVASSSSSIYAAHGSTISSLPFCREVTDSIDIGTKIKMLSLIGSQLVAIDIDSGIHIIETGAKLEISLTMEGGEDFEISSLVHPSTYLNKIVVGSTSGKLRIVNIRSGKVIHEFQRDFGSAITILEQTTALDVLAVGLESGEVVLFNVKMDKVLHTFRHDARITNISFRDDGAQTLVTADKNGTLAVWDLEKQELIGKITDVHTDTVNCLYFVPGEPILLSASSDNSVRLWIFDAADGMPRELVRLDGHSLPAAAVHFIGKNQLLSAGKDGSVRKYDVTSLTVRNKLGSVGPKKLNPNREVRNVEQMVVGWQREAAWNNVFCRQKDDTKVTSWHARNDTKGEIVLQHDRFRKKVDFVDAKATALCLSPCGNFVFAGYSTGHIDQFNAQSGRHVHSYSMAPKKKTKQRPNMRQPIDMRKAAESTITSLSVDQRGKELMSTDESGAMIFWSLATHKVTAKLSNKSVRCGISAASPTNSLIAVVSIADCGKESIVLIDTVCHRAVRHFDTVGKKVNAITFSSDGRWLLVADNDSYIRVFDVSTSHLIDVLLFSKPCVSISFNNSGEFLATCHEGERAVYVWANKALFLSHVNIRALDADFVPSWSAREDEPAICIDDDDDTMVDEELRALRELQIDEKLVTFSGLPASRWANLPDLAMIKERNKPQDAPRKIKQAPFFLSATATLDGFDFQADDLALEDESNSKFIQSKRDLLEMESSFSATLRKANTVKDLLDAFDNLQEMSISAIDFQIRSLNPKTIAPFFRMLLEVLKSRKGFELVQAYLATAVKTHRSLLWKASEDDEELTAVLEELCSVQENCWNEMEGLFVENMSIVQWIKNALL